MWNPSDTDVFIGFERNIQRLTRSRHSATFDQRFHAAMARTAAPVGNRCSLVQECVRIKTGRFRHSEHSQLESLLFDSIHHVVFRVVMGIPLSPQEPQTGWDENEELFHVGIDSDD